MTVRVRAVQLLYNVLFSLPSPESWAVKIALRVMTRQLSSPRSASTATGWAGYALCVERLSFYQFYEARRIRAAPFALLSPHQRCDMSAGQVAQFSLDSMRTIALHL